MNEQPKILITNQVPEDHLGPLHGVAQILQGHTGLQPLSRTEVLKLAPTLDAIISQGDISVDRELLDAAPRLRIVASVSIGTDSMDLPLMAERGVWATNVPDMFTDSTADAAIALLLNVARRISEADRFIRAGKWRKIEHGRWDGMGLTRKALGIVGFGKIGSAVACRARAFGMRINVYDPSKSEHAEYLDLDALLRQSDIVSLHVPLKESTRYLINRDSLANMKPGAVLINLSRGAVVDEEALVESLEQGHLGGAGLDVFEHEPNVHPKLLEMPNVVLTPHLGGGSREARRAARRLCALNVAKVLRGDDPMTPVNTPLRRPGLGSYA